MLTTEIKNKIDSARNILVGKVPDPKAQVEQITTALIYKFMDDMDKKAMSLPKGKAQFFTNGYEKYSWSKIMDTKLGGQERLNLYAEAIAKMSKNPHLPPLFCNIFKDAFLPYRDPETLNLFLKELNFFQYDHSENLGDAFEYLLSILGSQGDAGQFRTPRHIIDFIVEVIDPKKDESILDPACGTGGFLISAYKHILKSNKEKNLNPDEKESLMNNLSGYDISPDMVRLSQVNMYLHGFPNPHIYEYDTLTSDEKWEERFDVMMANPPFMTPKGGIRPHKRFSVQANRCEVLFVDYIMEHLNNKGRAGIIIPEGIIFQSGKAYKELRKNLVNDGLFSVVSLPAGVFNPYSGVKTSILFFDNEIAKKTKNVLFVKVESDGYDLGAQRRKIEKNDLPNASTILKRFSEYVRAGEKKEIIESFINKSNNGFIVSKEKIAEGDDYNLSADRYKIVNIKSDKYPIVKLADVVIEMKDGGTPPRDNPEYFGNDINWCVVKDIRPEIYNTAEKLSNLGLKNSSAKVWPVNSIIISLGASIGHVGITKVPTATKQGLSGIVVNEDKILPEFLAHILRNRKNDIELLATGVTIKEVRPSKLQELFTFPLPPLEIQKEIVRKIEIKQKAIDGAKQVIENLERERQYFSQSLRKLKGVEMIELGKIAEVTAGQSPEGKYYNEINDGIPFYQGKTEFGDTFLGEPKVWTTKVTKLAMEGDILMSVRAPVGPVNITKEKICIGRGLASIRAKNIEQIYLFNFLRSIQNEITGNGGAVFDSINKSQIERIIIPMVSIEAQKEIIEKVNIEERIIESNKKLIDIMEKKINEVLNDL